VLRPLDENELVVSLHLTSPDRSRGDENSTARFQEISSAWDTIQGHFKGALTEDGELSDAIFSLFADPDNLKVFLGESISAKLGGARAGGSNHRSFCVSQFTLNT
jgi:hypothetical protein